MSHINQKETDRVFQNPVLEALIRSNPWATGITYGLIISALLFINSKYDFVDSWAVGLSLYFGGLFTWTFFEYFLHRYVFHFVTESKFVQKFHHLVHGFHHQHPKDENHLFMPPLPGVILSTVFTAFFFLFWGTWTFVFSAGFLTGYLTYATVHYSTHKFKPPKNKHLKTLWKHHSLHHYKYPEKAFGVSSPKWDYVFRTMPPATKKSVKVVKKKKATAEVEVA